MTNPVVAALREFGLDFNPATDILLSRGSLNHAARHTDIAAYLPRLSEIVTEPQFAKYRDKDNCIELARKFDGETVCVIVPIRPSADGKYFIRTCHRLNAERFQRYVCSVWKEVKNT